MLSPCPVGPVSDDGQVKALTVGVDMDGPVFPYMSVLRDRLVAEGGPARRYRRLPEHYDFGCCWRIPDGDLSGLMARLVDSGGLLAARPVPGARAGLVALRSAGHRVLLVTARGSQGEPDPERMLTESRAFLEREGLLCDGLVSTTDKAGLGLDVMLDDLVPTVRAVCDSGALGVVWDRPWNRGLESTGLVRVRGWREFTRMIPRTIT